MMKMKKTNPTSVREHTLRIDDLSLSFRENELFRHFSYTFRPGIYVFSGESGVGKSSLMRCIAGLNKNYTGAIYLDEQKIKGTNRGVYMMHQHYMSFPWLSLYDNVLMVYKGGRKKITDEVRKEAEEIIERIGLGEHMHKRPTQVSGGQDQRDNLANAFMNKWSGVFLFDEPTSALDEKNILLVAKMMREYQQKTNSIYIVISHQETLVNALRAKVLRFTDNFRLHDAYNR